MLYCLFKSSITFCKISLPVITAYILDNLRICVYFSVYDDSNVEIQDEKDLNDLFNGKKCSCDCLYQNGIVLVR